MLALQMQLHDNLPLFQPDWGLQATLSFMGTGTLSLSPGCGWLSDYSRWFGSRESASEFTWRIAGVPPFLSLGYLAWAEAERGDCRRLVCGGEDVVGHGDARSNPLAFSSLEVK